MEAVRPPTKVNQALRPGFRILVIYYSIIYPIREMSDRRERVELVASGCVRENRAKGLESMSRVSLSNPLRPAAIT